MTIAGTGVIVPAVVYAGNSLGVAAQVVGGDLEQRKANDVIYDVGTGAFRVVPDRDAIPIDGILFQTL